MLVDLDHLFASPIFQADRCSINFHPLHTFYAMAVYVVLLFFRRPFNIIGIGLLLHMLTDFIDCLMMFAGGNVVIFGSVTKALLTAVAEFFGINPP